jgi:demethylspheroidene O-methyltransferase
MNPSTSLHPAPAGLHERWLSMRDRLLSSPAFLRRARQAPFGGAIARKRARALFDPCAGFVYAQVLQACVTLKVFDRLADGPKTVEQLAHELSLSEDATRQLLLAAVSLELLDKRRGDRFGLGILGAAMLANPGVAAMVEHHAMFYSDMKDPVALLRGEAAEPQLSRYWAYARSSTPKALEAADVSGYSALMNASVSLVADEIIDAYPIEQYRCLLDVGGGEGGFLKAAARRAPKLRLMLFDLPAVVERARFRLGEAGLSQRATTFGGDFFTDELPQGADIASLVRVIHDHDDAHALQILQAVKRALPCNGILLLAEPMSGTAGAEPVGDAYFSFYLRAMGLGQPRTRQQLESLLHRAGFPYVRLLPTRLPLQTQLLMASPKG